uniref:CCHC-type domain-containing protein n=2 Tax=Lutzomyia longipalpis TaxID=7200 RepID=A0A1B0GL56_LUTLO
MASNKSLGSLRREQRHIKRRLTSAENSATSDTISLPECHLLVDELLELRQSGSHVQNQILDLVAGNAEELRAEEEFESSFIETCDVILHQMRLRIIQASQESQNATEGTDFKRDIARALSQQTEMMAHQRDILQEIAKMRTDAKPVMSPMGIRTKLPQLELPKFDGKYSEWPTFFDAFKATIHDNTELSKNQKMQYLKLALSGSAAEAVKHMKITDDNYEILWTDLQARYGKKVHIVNEYIERFLNQQKVDDRSVTSLKTVVQNYTGIIAELRNMGSEYFTLDAWLIFWMKRSMDSETRKAWEESRDSNRIASLDEWFEFLDKRIDAMERWSDSQPTTSSVKKLNKDKVGVKSHHTEVASCLKCNQSGHHLFQCEEFKALTCADKRTFVTDSKVCFNCLRPSHYAKDCTSTSTCQKCNKHHHTWLHPAEPTEQSSSGSNSDSLVSHHCTADNHALLPTAVVHVPDKNGNRQLCRILLDSGGECTLISESCAQRLNLQREQVNIRVSGAAQTTVGYTSGLVSFNMHSVSHPVESIHVNALTMNNLTSNLPSSRIVNANKWKHIRCLRLADPHFDVPAGIDIILGVEYAEDIKMQNIIKGEAGTPVAQETIFGWVLGGKISGDCAEVTSLHTTHNDDDMLSDSCENNTDSNISVHAKEETFYDGNVVQNVKQVEVEGYDINLALNESLDTQGDSNSAAFARSDGTECEFVQTTESCGQLVDFMTDSTAKRHPELVPSVQEASPTKVNHISLHSFVKSYNISGKFSVEFEAPHFINLQSTFRDGILTTGTSIQDDLSSLLHEVQADTVSFIREVETTYHQMSLTSKQSISTYRLTALPDGSTSIPFSISSVPIQTAIDNSGAFHGQHKPITVWSGGESLMKWLQQYSIPWSNLLVNCTMETFYNIPNIVCSSTDNPVNSLSCDWAFSEFFSLIPGEIDTTVIYGNKLFNLLPLIDNDWISHLFTGHSLAPAIKRHQCWIIWVRNGVKRLTRNCLIGFLEESKLLESLS